MHTAAIPEPASPLPAPNIRARSEAEAGALYARIKSAIAEGRFVPGARLPTERALSSQYRVARNTVRKTMIRLVSEGLIVREIGRGSFVAKRRQQAPAREAEFSLPELLEARLLFEPALVELVIDRATEQDWDAFDAALDAMRAADTWVAFKEAKYALHFAIARASQNRFVVRLFELIIASRRAAGWGRPGGHPAPLSLVREAACRDNAAIIAALRARDVPRARALMHDHLVHTLSSVSGA